MTNIPREGQRSTVLRQFCAFQIEENWFGLDILDLREILTASGFPFAHIGHAPPSVRGYVNIRGQIFLILDLRVLLGYPPVEIQEGNRLLLFKPHVGEALGILVDRVGDIITADESQLETSKTAEVLNGSGRNQGRVGLFAAVCKRSDHLLTILNPSVLAGLVKPVSRTTS